jgi:hypothetical protein
MRSVLFTNEVNLERHEEQIVAGRWRGVNANEFLDTIRTIARLRADNKKLAAYKEAAEQLIFHDPEVGHRRLRDLANKQVPQEEIDETYLSWLSHELAGLSSEEWARVKRTREG